MTLLIAIDEGPFCSRIAIHGIQFGKQINSEIGLISVIDNSLNVSEGYFTARDLSKLLERDFRNTHRMLIEEIFKDNSIQSFVEEGKLCKKILSVANNWDADIIVIGISSRSDASGSIIGSVASGLLRFSTKPCFMVPAGNWGSRLFQM